MNYKQTKQLLVQCQESCQLAGCYPVADDIQIAIENLDYAFRNDFLEYWEIYHNEKYGPDAFNLAIASMISDREELLQTEY